MRVCCFGCEESLVDAIVPCTVIVKEKSHKMTAAFDASLFNEQQKPSGWRPMHGRVDIVVAERSFPCCRKIQSNSMRLNRLNDLKATNDSPKIRPHFRRHSAAILSSDDGRPLACGCGVPCIGSTTAVLGLVVEWWLILSAAERSGKGIVLPNTIEAQRRRHLRIGRRTETQRRPSRFVQRGCCCPTRGRYYALCFDPIVQVYPYNNNP